MTGLTFREHVQAIDALARNVAEAAILLRRRRYADYVASLQTLTASASLLAGNCKGTFNERMAALSNRAEEEP